MKKLLAILVAGAFATSAFAVDASAPMSMHKATASSAKAKHHHKAAKKSASGAKKSHKKASSAAM